MFSIFFFFQLYKNSYLFNENFKDKCSKIFKKLIKNSTNIKIRIGIYTKGISNGGRGRITAILLNNFHRIPEFELYLFTKNKKYLSDYIIPNETKRIYINDDIVKNIQKIKKTKIDILIYQLDKAKEIISLNNLKTTKVIFYLHLSIFFWIYSNLNYLKILYKAYKKSKYIVNIIPFENDYLFKRWGINSIYMTNFLTYEYNSVVPSDLSTKTILMIGRAYDKVKRFNLGIMAMAYIIKEVPESKLKIISSKTGIQGLQKLVKSLNIEKNVNFIGFTSKPEVYFKNASLHIFPTICESFGLVLSETKIYGIPNIVLGLNYVSIAKGGTVIIYDDKPESLANEAIKILKNNRYRKILGKNARISMKKFNNESLLLKWISLILSVYNGDNYYEILRQKNKKISDGEAMNIINSQIKLLKLRKPRLQNFTINDLLNII